MQSRLIFRCYKEKENVQKIGLNNKSFSSICIFYNKELSVTYHLHFYEFLHVLGTFEATWIVLLIFLPSGVI